MIECANVDMQDLLPDFVAGTLPARERAAVEVHLASCEACHAEHELLMLVRAARPTPASVNVAAIVAALPKPAAFTPQAEQSSGATERPFRIITGGQSLDSHRSAQAKVRRRATAERSFIGQSLLRYAAALTIVAVGGLSVVMARRSPASLTDAGVAPSAVIADSAFDLAVRPEVAHAPYAPGAVGIEPVVVVAPAVLPVQELSDYTEDELTLLLQQLEAWDGAPRVDSTSVGASLGGATAGEDL